MNDRYIVVYGLLKSMYDNEAAVFVRKHCRLVGEATFPGYLYDLENYPGVIYDEDSPFTVFGELFQITGDRVALTSFLDEFENVGPRAIFRKCFPEPKVAPFNKEIHIFK